MGRVVPIALALLLLRAITPCVAPAASFDCTKAATAGEKIVCGDPALSRLDEVLADKVFLAYQVNGKDLPRKHGSPIRAVAEDHYGYDWVKYVSTLTVEGKG